MKRASVWKGHALGIWHVDTIDGIKPMRCKRFRTYPAALAHALAEVHPPDPTLPLCATCARRKDTT